MQIVIEIDENTYKARQRLVANQKRMVDNVDIAIANGTPLQDLYDLEGLKSDMKALNCGYPYGLDYLLDCLDKRLGITIIESDTESEDKK